MDSAPITRTVVLPGQTPEGEYILCVLVKRSYNIVADGICSRASTDEKLIPGDVHYGDPMNTTVKYEADYVPFKLATDVVLNGKAYAPNGNRTENVTVSLSVEDHRKDLLVIGNRRCIYRENQTPLFTDPESFETMELRYENAYGGIDVDSDPQIPYHYPANHLGKGFAMKNAKSAIQDLELPNIEDPLDRLTPERLCVGDIKNWNHQPPSQGFGWYMKTWMPRGQLAGMMPADAVYAKEMQALHMSMVPQEQRASIPSVQLPPMDFRFFNGASLGLALPYLRGDESITLQNLSPEGELHFRLPGERPRVSVDIDGKFTVPSAILQTVMLRPEEQQVDLTWSAQVPYGGPSSLSKIRHMSVNAE